MSEGHLVEQLMQLGILVLVMGMGAGVVLTRDPVSQSMGVSLYGLLVAVMFFLFQAPDVALSQLTVGAVALPLMLLLALARIRRNEEEQKGEKRGQESAEP
jgi:energy-converting hydrogenase B subunit D